MEQKNKLKLNSGGLLVFILTVGVFGIINTEMGVVGILPLIATTFNVSVPQAGWTVSVSHWWWLRQPLRHLYYFRGLTGRK